MKTAVCFMMLIALGGQTLRAAIQSAGAAADAFVTGGSNDPSAGLPTDNYGLGGALMVSGASTIKGEMQVLFRFNLATAKNQFDLQFGTGQWTVTGITLQLGSNFGTQGDVPGNAIFNTINAGAFGVDWLANDMWGEGSGAPGAPVTPANPPTDGVTFATLGSVRSAADRALGSFAWDAPGSGLKVWSLALDVAFVDDVRSGGLVSLRAYPNDPTVAYLINSRTFNTSGNRPMFNVTAVAVPEPGAVSLLALAALPAVSRRQRRIHGTR